MDLMMANLMGPMKESQMDVTMVFAKDAMMVCAKDVMMVCAKDVMMGSEIMMENRKVYWIILLMGSKMASILWEYIMWLIPSNQNRLLL